MTNKHLQRYFEKRPMATTLFVVRGFVFVDPDKAAAFARQQKLEVETKTREEVMSDTNKDDQGGGRDNAGDEAREAAEKELLAMVLDENTDYHKAGALVKALGLYPDGKSKEDYLVVLSAEKERLTQK